jgi:restriction system-associated AAA family ATPase
MKVLYVSFIEVPHKPLLNGVSLDFPINEVESDEGHPTIFVGTNGSGKSQVLETLAEIFLYLDRLYRRENRVIVNNSPALFEIHYSIVLKSKSFFVNVKQLKLKGKAPEIIITDEEGNELEIDLDKISEYLPNKIIGYTSGDNETLSLPFTDYYDEYAKYTRERALGENEENKKDYDPRFYLMDYNTNIGVTISNLILGQPTDVKSILDYVGIQSLSSFQIIIQTKHTAAPGNDGVELTKELKKWINQLKKAATCFQYFPLENRYVLDFYMHGATKSALKHFFGTSINFYTALYKIELLNTLIIKEKHLNDIKKQRQQRKLIIKPPTVAEQDKVLSYSEIKLKLKSGEIVDYLSLSDGEHQFLNIFGTIMMTNFDNSLYLLDEPETHFNPRWRREFISLLYQLIDGRKQDFFITSHSPFIVADSKRDKVYVFRRDKKGLNVEWPIKETYGSDFDYILKTAFDLDTSLSKESYDQLQNLIKTGSLTEIEKKINEFGDSAEKLFLFKRMEELKKQKI